MEASKWQLRIQSAPKKNINGSKKKDNIHFILHLAPSFTLPLKDKNLHFKGKKIITNIMVKTNNKAVVFLKSPEEYPVPGEHFAFVDARESDLELNEDEVLTRNIYISLDPCKLFNFSLMFKKRVRIR